MHKKWWSTTKLYENDFHHYVHENNFGKIDNETLIRTIADLRRSYISFPIAYKIDQCSYIYGKLLK